MGRARIAMEFIRKEQKRDVTFQKRKKGLLKKADEFSILCNVPVCIIIYPYKEGNNQQSILPEVYTFKGDETSASSTGNSTCRIDLARAMDPKMARELIYRYLAFPRAEERNKRSLNLHDMFQERKRKADQELSKLRHKNTRVTISKMSVEQLMELLFHLDHKLENVKEKIAIMKNNSISEKANYLVPSTVIPTGDNNNSHFDLHQSGSFNQLVPFDPNGMYVDHNNGGCNFAYNMNMMEPIYFDQGPEIVGDNLISSSNNVGGSSLPISVPFQYLPMLSNFQLPKFY